MAIPFFSFTFEIPNERIFFVPVFLFPQGQQQHNQGLQGQPPASKVAIHSLEKVAANASEQCPVCLTNFEQGEIASQMPCEHKFHGECISEWLSRSNTCPCCRYEVMTDNEDYNVCVRERMRRRDNERTRDCAMTGIACEGGHGQMKLESCGHSFHTDCLRRELAIAGYDTSTALVNEHIRCPRCRQVNVVSLPGTQSESHPLVNTEWINHDLD